MASVQYLYGFGYNIPQKILENCNEIESNIERTYFAIVKIQTIWRGFMVRKMMKKWNQAATIVQKVFRGWLVRWHLPESFNEYYLRVQKRFFNTMAVRIQALYRGYKVRKSLQILERVRYERGLRVKNQVMAEKFKELFEEMRAKKMEEEDAKKAVLFTLFKSHHLLRTCTIEGVASLHGKAELSLLEKLMKSIPMKEYMTEVKKQFYKKMDAYQKMPPEEFENKKLQKIMTLYKLRDKSRDVKPQMMDFANIDLHKQSFKLPRSPIQHAYEKSLFCQGKYDGKKPAFCSRMPVKQRMMSQHDFDLYVLKKGQFQPKPGAYYTNYWKSLYCPMHGIESLFP